MVAIPNQPRVVKFGVFEVDFQSGEVRKSGMKQKLAGQPFQVLQALLENPHEIVTRERLRQLRLGVDAELSASVLLNRALHHLNCGCADCRHSHCRRRRRFF